LSGILYIDELECKYPFIQSHLRKGELWNEFSKPILLDKIPGKLNNFIISYINNNCNDNLFEDSRILMDAILRIWKKNHYQIRSNRINESTYTHDVLIHLVNFLIDELDVLDVEILIQWYFFEI